MVGQTLPKLSAPRVSRERKCCVFAASLELYSQHPLASAVVTAAKQERIETLSVEKIREKPGEGLKGRIAGKLIEITGRRS